METQEQLPNLLQKFLDIMFKVISGIIFNRQLRHSLVSGRLYRVKPQCPHV